MHKKFHRPDRTSVLFGLLLSIWIFFPISAQTNWTPLGPEGGFLLSLAVSPSNPEILFAGCDIYGGIYRSTNAGEQWQFMGLVSDLGNILDVEVHPTNDQVVFAACGDEGVYRSEDGGQTWALILVNDNMAYCVGIDPNSPERIFVGFIIDETGEHGLLISADGGVTWPVMKIESNSVLDIVFDPDLTNTMYLGTSGGVYQSADGGTNWNFLGPPLPSATIHSLAVGDANTIYAGTHIDERDNGSVFKTANGGATWATSLDLGTTAWSLAVDPQDHNTAYLAAGSDMDGDEGVFKTTDGGENWHPMNNGLVDRMAREIQINPLEPSTVYVGTDGLGGVYKTTDGADTWEQVTNGMNQTLIQSMAMDASNTLYAAVGWGTYRDAPAIFKSNNDGQDWVALSTLPSPHYMTSVWDVLTDPDQDNVIYVAGTSHHSDTKADPTQGILAKSEDAGETWQVLWTPDDIWIMCLAMDPVSKTLFAGTGGSGETQVHKIYKSVDKGQTWTETAGWQSPGNSLFDIVIDPLTPANMYAGSGGAFFSSIDGGENWQATALIPFCYTLWIDPQTPTTIYSGSGGPYADEGGIYKSTDSGTTWDVVGLAEHPVTSIIGIPDQPGTVYAGTGGKFLESNGRGIFKSTDFGSTWNAVAPGPTSPFILTFLLDHNAPGKLYTGTMGRGIYTTTLSTRIFNGDNAVGKISWMNPSNYPNPFNPSTTIQYYLSERTNVRIKIYDLLGHEITTLFDGIQSAGSQEIIWDASGMATGIYFYSVETGSIILTRKMVLMQ